MYISIKIINIIKTHVIIYYIENNLFYTQTQKYMYNKYSNSLSDFYSSNKMSLITEFLKNIIYLGDIETLNIFLSHSKVNLFGEIGKELLHFAALDQRNSVIAKILIKNGAYSEYLLSK